MEKMEGVVKWFSPEKGFGFIAARDMEDIFVHFSSIEKPGFRSLAAGQKVVFELGSDDRGPLAVKVQIKNN